MKKSKALNPLGLSLLAVLVGIVGGLGAVVFRGLIAFFHNLLFLGKISIAYDANVHTPANPWGFLVILVPVLGAIGVAFLVKNFAPEAKGHGVPEVMDSIYYNKGVIRPVVALIKSLASALSIGSGGAIGREGPIIQIGASFGSSIGQLIRMPTWQRITLIAAGAGSGIAATFNTPIGGVLFAVEIMLHEVSVRTLVPVAIATATATYIGRSFFGTYPSFQIPRFQTPYFHLTGPWVLLAYVGLGMLMGVVSALFIKSIYGFEDFFEKRIKGNYYTRHMSGMLLVGIMLYLLMMTTGHYYIEGVGYSTIQDILSRTSVSIILLLILSGLKLLGTSLTLGSGASGGIFSPALYLGATLGAGYGLILQHLFPGWAITPAAFAVAGMAGVVGGTTGAAMAAIVMIFEMTLDYNVIIPMTITVAVSYGVRKLLSKESIYTLKLVRRGHYMPEALQTNIHFLKRAKEIMRTRFTIVPAAQRLEEFVPTLLQQTAISQLVVEDDHRVVGFITKGAALEAAKQPGKTRTLGEMARQNYVIVSEGTTLFEVINKMRSTNAAIALVLPDRQTTSAEDIEGVIDKEDVADAMVVAVELFSD